MLGVERSVVGGKLGSLNRLRIARMALLAISLYG